MTLPLMTHSLGLLSQWSHRDKDTVIITALLLSRFCVCAVTWTAHAAVRLYPQIAAVCFALLCHSNWISISFPCVVVALHYAVSSHLGRLMCILAVLPWASPRHLPMIWFLTECMAQVTMFLVVSCCAVLTVHRISCAYDVITIEWSCSYAGLSCHTTKSQRPCGWCHS